MLPFWARVDLGAMAMKGCSNITRRGGSYSSAGCRVQSVYSTAPANWAIKSIDLYYLPTPPLGQDMTQGQFLSGV